MKITEQKHIHFTGIGGIGMLALATACKDLRIKITGSDTSDIYMTDEILDKRGIPWIVGFSPENLKPKPDLVITTGAHEGLNNPEVLAAKKLKIPVLTYAEGLANISTGKKTISVCGVGGKGSTASMITTIFEYANLKPSFVIGMGDIYPIGTSGRYRVDGEHFICEADEYAISPGVNDKPKFSLLNPYVTVVTNIEHDHPDIYPTFDDTRKVFRQYFDRIPKDGLLVACVDNTNVERMIPELKVPVATYGFNKDADYVISDVNYDDQKTRFLIKGKKNEVKATISVPGRYNIQNATGAYICARYIGLSEKVVLKGLEMYKGCKRRFEFMGEKSGVLYYDDYAHHPEEVKSLLKAFNEWFPDRRIISIFQPHTYSRTKILLDDFAESFIYADVIVFVDIYASAREKVDKTINSKILSKKVRMQGKKVSYTGSKEKTVAWIEKNSKPGDIVVTVGAGDIFQLHQRIS